MASKSIAVRPQTAQGKTTLAKSIDLAPKQTVQRKVDLAKQQVHPSSTNPLRMALKASMSKQNQPTSLRRAGARPISANTPMLASKSTLSTQRPVSQATKRPISQGMKRPATSQAIRVFQKSDGKAVVKAKAVSSIKSPQQKQKLQPRCCGICFDLLVTNRICTMRACGTKFHFKCVKDYILACAKSFDLLFKCPSEKCATQLDEKEVAIFLSQQERVAFMRKLNEKEAMENPTKLTICSTPDCSHIFTIPAENPDACANCPTCKKSTCLFCKLPYHRNMTCEENKVFKRADIALFERFAAMNWKRCMRCLFWIEKREGCNHMTCKCGHQFCYACGLRWKTCSC